MDRPVFHRAADHERQARIRREADELLVWLGPNAVHEARARATDAMGLGPDEKEKRRFWLGVADEIGNRAACRPHPTVGSFSAYEGRRYVIAQKLCELSLCLITLANGDETRPSLRSANEAIEHIVAILGRTPELETATQSLLSALTVLDQMHCRTASMDEYPIEVLTAVRQLLALKDMTIG